MAAAERWDAFLAQIDGRARTVRDEALATARASFSAVGVDTAPIVHAWSASESRLQELERMIQDTWHEKVDDAFSAEDASEAVRDAARDKGDALAWALEGTREHLGWFIMAELAQHLFMRALAESGGRFCTGCGAPLQVPVVYRAVELRCVRCNAVNGFEPPALLRAASVSGVHALAQLGALPQWQAMREAERAARRARSPTPFGLLKASEKAQIQYWIHYLHARSQLEPELGRQPMLEVRARMDQWYRSVEHEPAWMQAGCPRELP